jgi:hypothetical protein
VNGYTPNNDTGYDAGITVEVWVNGFDKRRHRVTKPEDKQQVCAVYGSLPGCSSAEPIELVEPSIPDLLTATVAGRPAMPFKRVLLDVPWQTQDVHVVAETEPAAGNTRLVPGIVLWPTQDVDPDTGEALPFSLDTGWYTSEPSSRQARVFHLAQEPFTMRNRKIQRLDIEPLTYFPESATVGVASYRKIDLGLEYYEPQAPDIPLQPPVDFTWDAMVDRMVSNVGMFPPIPRLDPGDLPLYVVIADAQDMQVVKDFVSNKPDSFYYRWNTASVSGAQWNGGWTSEAIAANCVGGFVPTCISRILRDSLIQQNLRYVLFAADEFDIPPGFDEGSGLFGSNVPSQRSILEISGKIKRNASVPWLLLDCGDYCDFWLGSGCEAPEDAWVHVDTPMDPDGDARQFGRQYDNAYGNYFGVANDIGSNALTDINGNFDAPIRVNTISYFPDWMPFCLRVANYEDDISVKMMRGAVDSYGQVAIWPAPELIEDDDIANPDGWIGRYHVRAWHVGRSMYDIAVQASKFPPSSDCTMCSPACTGRDWWNVCCRCQIGSWSELIDLWLSDFNYNDASRAFEGDAWFNAYSVSDSLEHRFSSNPYPGFRGKKWAPLASPKPFHFSIATGVGDGYYMLLDDDAGPDIAVGRIPARRHISIQSGQALANAFAKIENYLLNAQRSPWGSTSMLVSNAINDELNSTLRMEVISRYPFGRYFGSGLDIDEYSETGLLRALPTFVFEYSIGSAILDGAAGSISADEEQSEEIKSLLEDGKVGSVFLNAHGNPDGAPPFIESTFPDDQAAFPVATFQSCAVGPWYESAFVKFVEKTTTLNPKRGFATLVANEVVTSWEQSGIQAAFARLVSQANPLGFVVPPFQQYPSTEARLGIGDAWTASVGMSYSFHSEWNTFDGATNYDEWLDTSGATQFKEFVHWVIAGDPSLPVFLGHDVDRDGVDNSGDNCLLDSNWAQTDAETDFYGDEIGDGIGDACDNCIGVINQDQLDNQPTFGEFLSDAPGAGNECVAPRAFGFAEDFVYDGWVHPGQWTHEGRTAALRGIGDRMLWFSEELMPTVDYRISFVYTNHVVYESPPSPPNPTYVVPTGVVCVDCGALKPSSERVCESFALPDDGARVRTIVMEPPGGDGSCELYFGTRDGDGRNEYFISSVVVAPEGYTFDVVREPLGGHWRKREAWCFEGLDWSSPTAGVFFAGGSDESSTLPKSWGPMISIRGPELPSHEHCVVDPGSGEKEFYHDGDMLPGGKECGTDIESDFIEDYTSNCPVVLDAGLKAGETYLINVEYVSRIYPWFEDKYIPDTRYLLIVEPDPVPWKPCMDGYRRGIREAVGRRFPFRDAVGETNMRKVARFGPYTVASDGEGIALCQMGYGEYWIDSITVAKVGAP